MIKDRASYMNLPGFRDALEKEWRPLWKAMGGARAGWRRAGGVVRAARAGAVIEAASRFRAVALCAASVLLPAVASAQVDPNSATSAMPGCRAAVAEPRRPADYSVGYCTGVVSGVSYMALDVCTPARVTLGQMMRVVVHYIDARPARQHETFEKLVEEALKSAWPCPR